MSSDPSPGTDLTPARPDDGNGLIPSPGDRRMWTSYDLSTPAGKIAVHRATQDQDFKGDEWINGEFSIEHVVLHTVQVVSAETGELRPAVRIALVSPDGEIAGFVSAGVYGSLVSLFSLYGKPPWNPALRVKLVQRPKPGGRRLFLLELVQ